MAAFDHSRPQVLFPRLEGFVTSLFSAVIAWNDARRIKADLSRLSDRELADIGLNRGDIDDVAAQR